VSSILTPTQNAFRVTSDRPSPAVMPVTTTSFLRGQYYSSSEDTLAPVWIQQSAEMQAQDWLLARGATGVATLEWCGPVPATIHATFKRKSLEKMTVKVQNDTNAPLEEALLVLKEGSFRLGTLPTGSSEHKRSGTADQSWNAFASAHAPQAGFIANRESDETDWRATETTEVEGREAAGLRQEVRLMLTALSFPNGAPSERHYLSGLALRLDAGDWLDSGGLQSGTDGDLVFEGQTPVRYVDRLVRVFLRPSE
jgi:hypothetical protein